MSATCENLDDSPLRRIEHIVHSQFANRCGAFVVIATLAAWLSLTNHCAIGALLAASDTAPMHCHAQQPLPAKKKTQEQTLCCKVLRATFSAAQKDIQAGHKDFVPAPDWLHASAVLGFRAQFQSIASELDTGPPGVVSFAESVLQRSILAHAPPVSL